MSKTLQLVVAQPLHIEGQLPIRIMKSYNPVLLKCCTDSAAFIQAMWQPNVNADDLIFDTDSCQWGGEGEKITLNIGILFILLHFRISVLQLKAITSHALSLEQALLNKEKF